MNEVDKLYENAGVVLIEETENGACCKNPFTAEKQLELIKWMINKVDYITMWHFDNSKKPYDFDLGSHNSGGATFEDALAQMINNLWQDLTDAEKAQIKNILESEVRE